MRIVSWNGNAINDSTNYSAVLVARPLLWDSSAQLVSRNDARPGISNIAYDGVRFVVDIAIEGSDTDTLRKQLAQWFNPRDKQSKPLVIEDSDGGNDRYLMCVCEGLRPRPNINRMIFAAQLVLDGFGDQDGRWRKTIISSDVWNITATGQTTEIDNDGHDIAYPIFTIEPTGAKTGDYAFKRWVPIVWGMDVTVNNYPTELTGGWDTETIIAGGDMLSTGNDLRVMNDGNEVDRWLHNIDTSVTKVWANINYQPRARAELVAGMLSGDTVLTLDVEAGSLELENGWFDLFPNSGILLIGSEAFTYTGKNASLFRFTGVRRAQRGTTAAAHSAGDTVHWIQHDIYILYGNSGAGTPPSSTSIKPIFSLGSSNTAWIYEDFYDESNISRPGRWAFVGEGFAYGGDHGGTSTNPYQEIGINRNFGLSDMGTWYTFNPCGITNANFTNGEKFAVDASWVAGIDSSLNGSSWVEEYAIPEPSVDNTWESWSRDEALNTGSIYVRLRHHSIGGPFCSMLLECADVTLTLNSDNTPVATLGAEQGNYQLNCIITNNTNGHAIQVTYTMATGQEFEVDTDNKTLTDLEDDSSQFQALTLIGSPRRDWIPLEVGTNELQFDDTGTTGVTVTVEWYERYFD